MAQRRMFSLQIVDTDAFLDMPSSAQSLYFHLGMRADDDGFVASPRRIISTVSSAIDDMNILISKGFVIPFDSGVCVITHWKENNYIRSDRYKKTRFISEKEQLTTATNGDYKLLLPDGIPNDNQAVDERYTQDRLGKDRLVEDRKEIMPDGKNQSQEKQLEKSLFGEFGKVRMTDVEYGKLTKQYKKAVVDNKIAYLDAQIQSGIKKYKAYKDHYATIGAWCRSDGAAAELNPDRDPNTGVKFAN